MSARKNEIIASVARARIELEQAIDDLKTLPTHDPLLFGFVSRTLKNYIHISRATLTLVGRALPRGTNLEVIGWLDGLQVVTKRMENLVEELQGAPAVKAPQLTFRKVNLAILVRRACEFYRPVAARKHVEIVFQDSGTSEPIWTDRIAVAVIMDNLLSNAVKFSPAEKKIVVRLRDRDAGVLCTVQDEGPGIRMEDRAALFQRNARRSITLSKDSPDLRYGLLVAGELVALLGGDIWCDTQANRGSCFSFQLPRSRQSRRRTHAPASLSRN